MNAILNFKNDALDLESPQPQPNSHQRILVVEDESELRQLNAEVLIDAGYQVDVAGDGKTAWTALEISQYDLMVTDQFLPKLSGVELLKKIYDTKKALPVIMITEIVPTWEFTLHPCLQAVIMLRKPYTLEKFLGMVKGVLSRPTATNEASSCRNGKAGVIQTKRAEKFRADNVIESI